ncbi:SAVED domain-containing protein [Aeromicrobium sp. Leaf350]|uniref:SAVED domain-containing protein n=1 Tax=Aeromicrobium sp. Leaf350 TaxID=2876565 RepID=UPI001E64E9D7|nr:SAVED domain-containing protein [Aeromicrobium sp. Leaf350]
MSLNPTDPVFISYRQSDGSEIAVELAWLLRAAGIPVWRDRDDLPPGDTEKRLVQAMDAGLSGAVLVITPEVAESEIVRFTESPRLIQIHSEQPQFVLGIANGIEREPGRLDYKAPDRVLAKPAGTLSGVDQSATDREGLIELVGRLVFHRIAAQREMNASGDTFSISLQTRNTPQVYDRTGSELDIRVRPSIHERLPSVPGLTDFADVLRFLPDAVTRSSATRVQISGGAHLSVAFALGAALPSSRVGDLEVVDQSGEKWVGAGEATLPHPAYLKIRDSGANPAHKSDGRPKVAVYLDLLSMESGAAFDRYLGERGESLSAWRHLRPVSDELLDPGVAGALAAEAAYHLREVSASNANAEVHVMLRCPFAIAVLVARLCNTLRITAYEWDDSDPSEEDNDYRPRYVPTLKIRPSAPNGVVDQVIASH